MNNAEKQAARVARHRAQRQWVDGMWIHPDASHGTRSGYGNYGCRCPQCRAFNAAAARRNRERFRQARVKIDGRPVAPGVVHGKAATYWNHSCRCVPCTEAHRKIRRRQR